MKKSVKRKSSKRIFELNYNLKKYIFLSMLLLLVFLLVLFLFESDDSEDGLGTAAHGGEDCEDEKDYCYFECEQDYTCDFQESDCINSCPESGDGDSCYFECNSEPDYSSFQVCFDSCFVSNSNDVCEIECSLEKSFCDDEHYSNQIGCQLYCDDSYGSCISNDNSFFGALFFGALFDSLNTDACNYDGICNSEDGETMSNCITDCSYCVNDQDCIDAALGDYCDDGSCYYEDEEAADCTFDEDCLDAGLGDYCNGGFCEDTIFRNSLPFESIACVEDSDCPFNVPLCGISGTCLQCNSDSDCGPGIYNACFNGECHDCNFDSQCDNPSFPVCRNSLKKCVECILNSQCNDGELCSTSKNTCGDSIF